MIISAGMSILETKWSQMFLLHRDSDIADYIAKYNKYEADYVRRIKAKYFSKNAMNGGKQPLLN